MLDYRYITKKWGRLRRFAGFTISSALDSIKRGEIDIATFFSKLLYFLPYSSRSLEKVLYYGLIRASHGYHKKDPGLYTTSINDIPISDPDEKKSVEENFKFLIDLGVADRANAEAIRFRPNVIDEIVRPIAHIFSEVSPEDVGPEVTLYPHRVISGISSLYVMYKGGRLPKCYSILTGLVSPIVKVDKNGKVSKKNTIETNEWMESINNMSKIRKLRDRFPAEYFKARGFMEENNIIVRKYPIEISGHFIENVIVPAYKRYYNLLLERARRR